MALSRRNVVGEISAASVGTGSFTTSSQTVNSGELLVVIVYSNSGGTISASNLTIADSGTGATYTSRQTFDATPSSDMAYRVWTGVATNTGSVTFTADAGADSTDTYSVVVFAYTGADTTNPIGATGNFSQTGETTQNPSFTLGATPATTSEVVGFWGIDINTGLPTQAPGSTFTEQYNTGLSGHSCFDAETRTGSTSTTVDMADINEAGGSISGVGAIGFEIVAAADLTPVGPAPFFFGPFAPQNVGRLAWQQWQPAMGYVDATPVVSAPNWAQTISGLLIPPPAPSAVVYPGIFVQVVTPPAQAVFQTIQATVVPQPLQPATVIPGWNPSAVETVPVPVLIRAAALGQPVPFSAIYRGVDPNTVETVPVPPFITGRNLTQPPPPAQVFVALTPGTAPVTSFFVPLIQAANIPQPPAYVRVTLGLTPGTAPVSVFYAPVVQAAAVSQVVQTAVVVRGLHHPLVETVPVVPVTYGRSILQPVQRAASLTVPFPPYVAYAPVVYGTAIVVRLPDGRLYLGLTPGTPPPEGVPLSPVTDTIWIVRYWDGLTVGKATDTATAGKATDTATTGKSTDTLWLRATDSKVIE